jgi:biopolymer transport protein TolR
MGMTVSAHGKGGKQRPTPEVNVTPLVDVALVVLIIFMVVTPLAMKSFWLNIPKEPDEAAAQPPSDADKPLVLTIDREGEIRINQAVVPRAELAERLPRMIAANRRKVLHFDAHDEAPYGLAVEVMDLCRSSGARSIAIFTEKPKS